MLRNLYEEFCGTKGSLLKCIKKQHSHVMVISFLTSVGVEKFAPPADNVRRYSFYILLAAAT